MCKSPGCHCTKNTIQIQKKRKKIARLANTILSESLFDVDIQVEIFPTTHQTIASEGQQCRQIYQLKIIEKSIQGVK